MVSFVRLMTGEILLGDAETLNTGFVRVKNPYQMSPGQNGQMGIGAWMEGMFEFDRKAGMEFPDHAVAYVVAASSDVVNVYQQAVSGLVVPDAATTLKLSSD